MQTGANEKNVKLPVVVLLKILFWVSLLLLVYSYLGYGILLWCYNKARRLFTRRTAESPSQPLPPVTFIVTAYNEAEVLEEKIKNSLALDYPGELLHFVFITDGSDDHSPAIMNRYPQLQHLHETRRRGKTAAINRAMDFVKTPVVVFSDANTMVNKEALQKIVPHYSDPLVGGVAGEKKIIRSRHGSAVGQAEGLYWQYESWMKRMDAEFYTVVGAAGELFSLRTSLFEPLAENILLDDFIQAMRVCEKGYRMTYEPGAYAEELPSASLLQEQKRKVRIAAGAYQATGLLKKAANIFRNPVLAWQYISRRLLRWLFCPPAIGLLLAANTGLVWLDAGGFFWFSLLLQVVFYVMAFTGWLFVRKGKPAGIFTPAFYFLFMNHCLVKGAVRYITNRQPVLWEKSKRESR